MSSLRRCVLVLVWGVAVAAAMTLPVSAQEQTWIRQFGTSAADGVYAAARTDAGGVTVAGGTAGNIAGTHYGLSDVMIARYDASGAQVWVRQSGTSDHEWAWSVAPDGAGGVFVAGTTNGNLGGANAGRWDAWLARYDGDGNQLWIRQFGTSGDDEARALAPDGAGGVFVAGDTSGDLGGQNAGNMDIWLARYDASGNRVWLRQIGTNTGDRARGLASDGAGGFFLSGYTFGNLGGQNAGLGDVIIARFDGAGNQTWIRQIGTAAGDYTESAAAPDGAGGVYIAGSSYGSLGGTHRGGEDAWLARYDSAGSQVWITQFGTTALDVASGVTSDGSGGAVVAGVTYGDLAGPNAGQGDAWLAAYDAAGSQSWVRQFGSSESDGVTSIAAVGENEFCLGGDTYGNLGGPNAGESDAWLALYAGDPSITVPLKGYSINRGTRISGNILSMMHSDPYYLKVASAPGDIYHVAETTVRAKTTVLAPSRLDIRTEARATESNVQTRIALRNLNSNTWDTIAQFAQPTTDTVRIVQNIPNPQHYVRQSDGLIRVRIQMIRALSRGPFDQWIDHVEVKVWE